MSDYFYTEIPNNSPIPIVNLELSNPNNPQLATSGHGILDTGADCTLVPFSLIAGLQLKTLMRGRSKKIIFGVGGKEIYTVPYGQKRFFTIE